MSTRKKAPKSVQMSFRVTKHFRDALQAAADRDKRSQANMLEIVLDYYLRNVIEQDNADWKPAKKKAAKKKAAKKR